MKVFAIKDNDLNKKTVAYLFCYEREGRFYIELPEDAEFWETPMPLDSFLKRGQKSINAYWSRQWVLQRLIPPERQNIGQILRDMNLDAYDEYAFLVKYKGRCAQDNLYLEKISVDSLPEAVVRRENMHVEDVCAITGHNILVFFRDGSTRKINTLDVVRDAQDMFAINKTPEIFSDVSVQPGGFGIRWKCGVELAFDLLYKAGAPIDLSYQDLIMFVKNNTIDTSAAAERLGCSRQNIDDLTSRKKLNPIKSSAKYNLYLKKEITERLNG